MEAVALWVNRRPNKEFDLQMTGSQEVLFWYERTIISLQFFINLIRRKYFRIQASMNMGSDNSYPKMFLFRPANLLQPFKHPIHVLTIIINISLPELKIFRYGKHKIITKI